MGATSNFFRANKVIYEGLIIDNRFLVIGVIVVERSLFVFLDVNMVVHGFSICSGSISAILNLDCGVLKVDVGMLENSRQNLIAGW